MGSPNENRPAKTARFFLLAAAIFTAFAALFLVYFFARTLAALILSIAVADALSPVADFLHRRMRRVFAVALIYAVLVGIAAGILAFLGPRLAQEAQSFTARAPQLLEQTRHSLSFLPPQILNQLANGASALAQRFVDVPLAVGKGLLTFVLIFFLSMYWLLAMPIIWEYIGGLLPPGRRPRVYEVRNETEAAMGGYFRGVAINGAIIGCLSWAGLAILGIDYAFTLGIISGFAEFIPYVGPILAAIPAVLVALMQSPGKAVWTLILYTAIHQVEGHLLTPNIMRSQTNLPQVLVIIALFAGGSIGGVLGAIVAVPLAGACKVIVTEVVAPRIRRTWAAPSPVAGD